MIFVVALRQNIKDLLVLLNHFLFPSGNGTKSVWTSSLAFQKPRKEMMPSSLSLIDFPKLLTSFQFASRTAIQLADLYVSRIVSLHGVPSEINSDRGRLFTSRFRGSFQNAMGTHLFFSTSFHPQYCGQVERVNQILEDMLRSFVISFGKNWEKCLPFAEFAYNNSFQSSLNMLLLNSSMDEDVEHPLTGQKPVKDNSLDRI